MIKIIKHLEVNWPDDVTKVLEPHHLEDLRKSGLSDETILEARIYSVTSQEAKDLLNRENEIGSGYVIPYRNKKGFSSDINFKPDNPLPDKNGKLRKYFKPIGAKQRLHISKRVWMVLDKVNVLLIFIEGEKKGLKAVQEGFYAIALSGVWNWLTEGRAIEDFNLIRLKGRKVYIAFDSDKYTNPQVLKAEERLAKFLRSKGAHVEIIDLREDPVL